MTRCPSELELEAHLLAPSPSRVADHVATCGRCRAQIALLERLGDEFRREVFPRTVDAVVARAPRRWALPRWLLAAPLVAGVAAAAVLALLPGTRPPAGYLGAKGEELSLTVLVHDGGGTRVARDGETVAAQAPIRFEVRPARACRLWVVSVDGAGEVSRLYPAVGDAAALGGAGLLPGGAVLDGRAGPERVFAICAATPLAWSEVSRAAHAAAAGGPDALRTASRLPGLPPGAWQGTVLLEKRP